MPGSPPTAVAETCELDVGIVHEWLTNRAGSEKCVEVMRRSFPRHRLYTSLFDPAAFPGWEPAVTTSALQRMPLVRRSHLVALPLVPAAMRRLATAASHDVLIRSFHSFATLPASPVGVPQLVYCYTPPRFIYRRHTMSGESPLVRAGGRVAAALLGPGDRRRMASVDRVVAISAAVADRVEAAYGRRPDVVHPPVDVARFSAAVGTPKGEHFVYCSRLVPYKRPDLAVEAFRGLPHRLIVAGTGRMRDRLEAIAPPNVDFVGHVPDDALPSLLASARGFVFPGEEDFGIAPVEALAAGTPVIALRRGGALDYVQPPANGVLVDAETPAAFAYAVVQVADRTWDPVAVSATAQRFSEEQFVHRIREAAEEVAGLVRR